MTPPKDHTTPLPDDWRREVYKISQEVYDRNQPGHMRACENDSDGPACKLAGKISTVEDRVRFIEDKHQRQLGRAQSRTNLVALISVGTSIVMMLVAVAAFIHSREAQPRPTAVDAELVQEMRSLKAELRSAGIGVRAP